MSSAAPSARVNSDAQVLSLFPAARPNRIKSGQSRGPRPGKTRIFCLYSVQKLVVIELLVLLALANQARDRDPEDVDFGPSYFDQFCNWTFRPESVSSQENRSFITYGWPVARPSYQYLALLVISDGTSAFMCTASLLDDRHLLTAAHCVIDQERINRGSHFSDFVKDTKGLAVVLGIAELNVSQYKDKQFFITKAEAVLVYPDYDTDGLGSVDLAVIRTTKTIPFNDYIQPVCLASASDKLPEHCVALGYGETEKGHLSGGTLYRAPHISTFSNTQCTQAPLRDKAVQFFSELFANFSKMSEDEKNILVSNLVDYRWVGWLCSLLNTSNNQSACFGDSGGPLMCTPVGTPKSEEYQNPQSPLFNRTDPSLKQFGVANALLFGKKCAEKGLMTSFSSVKHHRLWLEYVVLPSMKDIRAAKKKETTRVMDCLMNQDFTSISTQTVIGGAFPPELEPTEKLHICRKLHTYLTCVENSPDHSYCDLLYNSMLHFEGNKVTKVDMKSMFHDERCLQLDVCDAGARPLPASLPVLLFVALCACNGWRCFYHQHYP